MWCSVLHAQQACCKSSVGCEASLHGGLRSLPIPWPGLHSAARLVKGPLHWLFLLVAFSLSYRALYSSGEQLACLRWELFVGLKKNDLGDVIRWDVEDSHFCCKLEACNLKYVAFSRQARSNTRCFWGALGKIKRSTSLLLWFWSLL